MPAYNYCQVSQLLKLSTCILRNLDDFGILSGIWNICIPLQEKILTIVSEKNIGVHTTQYRRMVGEKLPQKIKHHLSQLERKGFILIDRKNKKISRISNKAKAGNIFVSIPIVGAANCGPATIYADQNVEGYLKISKRLVPNKKKCFRFKSGGQFSQ